MCPVCGNVRRDRGEPREPLCDEAGVRHPDRDQVQSAPAGSVKAGGRVQLMTAMRPVVMVRVTGTIPAPVAQAP